MDILQSALSDESENQPQTEAQAPEADQVEATGEQTAATPAETQEPQQDEPTKGLQAALIAERRKRQELEAWIRSQQQAAPRQEQQASEGVPDPANYQGNEQQYWRDLARHEARQELLGLQEQARRHAETVALNERVAKQQERMAQVVTAGQSKYRDFDAVINGGLAPFLSDSLREELGASEQAEDVAYFLGKNPGEAARLAQLDPRSLAREIVRLEQKVRKPEMPAIPQTLTQARDSRGRFDAPYDGPTPLDAVLGRK